MIEAKIALRIFLPLRGMPAEPSDAGVIQTRVKALAEHARSEGHAARVVKQLSETLTYFPAVAEIAQTCETTPDDSELADIREKCPCCAGTGFIIISTERGDGAKRCHHNTAR
jgi:hypothetical protein